MKIPLKLARKLARMAAAAGLPFREFVERALTLATAERRAVFISFRYEDALAYNSVVRAAAKAAGASGWTLYVDGYHGPRENQ
jgi:hypothetical protein